MEERENDSDESRPKQSAPAKKRETTVGRRCMETAVGMAGFMCVLDSFTPADVVLYALQMK